MEFWIIIGIVFGLYFIGCIFHYGREAYKTRKEENRIKQSFDSHSRNRDY